MFDDLETNIENIKTKSAASAATHPCHHCGGSGLWSGGVNRHGERKCFSCGGKGYFKSSYADRQKAKAKREQAKANKQLKNIASFEQFNPELFAYMDAERNNGNDFMMSMIEAIGKYGDLTDKQMEAVERSFDKYQAAMSNKSAWVAEHEAVVAFIRSKRGNFFESLANQIDLRGSLSDKQLAVAERIMGEEASQSKIDLTPIHAVFATATDSGLKRPIIRMDGFAISAAPESGRNAGFLYVKRNGEYMGKISPEGVYSGGKSATDKLIELAKDPKAAMQAYGRETGICSCCGRQLTDPLSVKMGIGPICAENFGF